jgi:hypothetical protein
MQKRYPLLIPVICQKIVRSYQSGILSCSDQVEDLEQSVKAHFCKRDKVTGKNFLERFDLARMPRTPENGWKAYIFTGAVRHYLNERTRKSAIIFDTAKGITCVHTETYDPRYVREDELRPYESHEKIVAHQEWDERFREFLKQTLQCPVTSAVYAEIVDGDGADREEAIAVSLGISIDQVMKAKQNLRRVLMLFRGVERGTMMASVARTLTTC